MAWEEGKAATQRTLWETSRRIAYYVVATQSSKPPRTEADFFRLPWVDGEYVQPAYDPEAEAELLARAQAQYDKSRPING